ncbi:hypothetical protein HDU67_002145, partial [Dinochytrium kinnereticum]
MSNLWWDGQPRPYLSSKVKIAYNLTIVDWLHRNVIQHGKHHLDESVKLCEVEESEDEEDVTAGRFEYFNVTTQRIEVGFGFEELAAAIVYHIYGTPNVAEIRQAPCRPYPPFELVNRTKVESVSDDPRGVSKKVIAVDDIGRGDVIGIYDGRWEFHSEQVASGSILNRLNLESKSFGSVLWRAPLTDLSKPHDDLILNGGLATGLFQWVTE